MSGQLSGWIDDTEHIYDTLEMAKCVCEHKGHWCGGVTKRAASEFEVHDGKDVQPAPGTGGVAVQSWLIEMTSDYAGRKLQWAEPTPGVNFGHMIRQDLRLEKAQCECELNLNCRGVSLVRPGVFQGQTSACLHECTSTKCAGHRNWVIGGYTCDDLSEAPRKPITAPPTVRAVEMCAF